MAKFYSLCNFLANKDPYEALNFFNGRIQINLDPNKIKFRNLIKLGCFHFSFFLYFWLPTTFFLCQFLLRLNLILKTYTNSLTNTRGIKEGKGREWRGSVNH